MQPKYEVIVTALRGVNARTGLDEKTNRVTIFPNGTILTGYFIETSSEGVQHVYVENERTKLAGWIRISEKDGSDPLVSIHEISNPQKDIAAALNRIADAIEGSKK